MVSWCGSESTLDIVLPTYIYSSQIIDYNLHERNMHFSSKHHIPWKEKISKAIFRGKANTIRDYSKTLGRDSNELRLKLAKMTEEEPEGMVDAGITAFFFHPEQIKLKKERMPFEDFFKVILFSLLNQSVQICFVRGRNSGCLSSGNASSQFFGCFQVRFTIL